MTSAARAEARQSMDRTSSPPTYSRSESNSVPWPRTITAVRPSSSRSRASFDGRCLREVNGGSTRTRQGTSCDPCRPASPSGPSERTVTRAAGRSPRRVGRSRVVSRRRSPAGTSSRCRCSTAPALGGQASRSRPRTRRRDGLVTRQPHLRRLAQPHGGVAVPVQLQRRAPDRPARRPRASSSRSSRGDEQHAETGGEQQPDRGRRGQPRQAGPPGQRHEPHHQRGTGTAPSTPSSTASGVTPSSSASGRSSTRCRRAGRASALTSSGVT